MKPLQNRTEHMENKKNWYKIPAKHDRSMAAMDLERAIKAQAQIFRYQVTDIEKSLCYFTDRQPRKDSKVWEMGMVWDNENNVQVTL
jgi:hypothetical protein